MKTVLNFEVLCRTMTKRKKIKIDVLVRSLLFSIFLYLKLKNCKTCIYSILIIIKEDKLVINFNFDSAYAKSVNLG